MDQRRIDDVGVADHPADVGGAPPDLARLDAVEIVHRPFQRDQVPAIVAHHALGDAGRARGVENVERIGGGDRHAFARLGVFDRVLPGFAPVVVAARRHRRLALRALQDEAGAELVFRQRDRLIEQRLVRHDAVDLDAAGRGEDHLGLGVVDAGGEFLGGKAAEHHRMNGADARAGEHGEHRLRHHRHIEDDAVAFADAEVAQHGAEQLHLGEHAAVGEGLRRIGDGGIVDQRHLVVARGDVAVERVVAGVDDAIGKPAAVEPLRLVEDFFRLFVPVDGLGRLAPEAFRIALPARVDVGVAARPGVHGCPPIFCLGPIVERGEFCKQVIARQPCANKAGDARPPPL